MKMHRSIPAAASRSSPTDDAPALVAALNQAHIDVEAEKSGLARVLHDDVGGLLVGATMDIGWVANQPGLSDAVKDKLARAQKLMRAAIDTNRGLVEDLKPTLLDNVGLYPTLRWHMKTSCKAACVSYTEDFPASEGLMTSEVRLGVFRIFQEALKDVLSRCTRTGLSVRVEAVDDVLHCHLIHISDGCSDDAAHSVSPETSMHLRAQLVGGSLQWSRTKTGRHLHLQVPLLSLETQSPR